MTHHGSSGVYGASRPTSTSSSAPAPRTNGAWRCSSVPATVAAVAAATTSTSRSAVGSLTTTSADGTSATPTAAPSAAHEAAPARRFGSAISRSPTAAGSVYASGVSIPAPPTAIQEAITRSVTASTATGRRPGHDGVAAGGHADDGRAGRRPGPTRRPCRSIAPGRGPGQRTAGRARPTPRDGRTRRVASPNATAPSTASSSPATGAEKTVVRVRAQDRDQRCQQRRPGRLGPQRRDPDGREHGRHRQTERHEGELAEPPPVGEQARRARASPPPRRLPAGR